MTFNNLAIPANAQFFYASDALGSFYITQPNMWKYPGVCNQSGVIQPGQLVEVYLLSASFGLLPLTTGTNGLNVDLVMALYDVTTGASFNQILPFVNPYGQAANGLVINQTVTGNQNVPAFRQWGVDTPLKVGCTAPNISGRQYQVGAAFQFHLGLGTHCQYAYHVHGAVVAT